MPPAPTLKEVQSLYAAFQNTSHRFTSYNFHNYFLRRTHLAFKPVLESLNPQAGSEVQAKQLDPAQLSKWFVEQQKELEVIKRAAEVNRMFQGPKLVVEHARPITAGGGEGAEASP
ncbi:uncharacterized protein I303_101968 [Kwoniella dejecticola CBS 10117]|uniref:Mitochondrial protein n=1 Tax=Kwoniella dejecticola CBS 10117 TaxID=1296121 RepID=A0A1A6ACC1_9TREE|nr:mitochondrial protein [Kwoniella dejecticola CBS 10117]OBR87688.1 mitochondrial protein [Kwoniella dejecticola CBS 10117]